MKKLKFLSLLCSAIIVFSFGVFAEEATTAVVSTVTVINETTEEKTKVEETVVEKQHKSDLMEILGKAQQHIFICEGRYKNGYPFTGFEINFEVGSRIFINTQFPLDINVKDEDLPIFTEEQKELFAEYWIQLEEQLEKTEDFSQTRNFDNCMGIKIGDEIEMQFRDDYVQYYHKNKGVKYYKLKDFEKTIEIIEKIVSDVYAYKRTGNRYETKIQESGMVYTFDLDKNICYKSYKGRITEESIKYIEKLNFDVDLNDSYFHTIFDEIKGNGNKITCDLKHYTSENGARSYYFLNLKGNGGETTLFSTSENKSTTGTIYGSGGHKDYINFEVSWRYIDNSPRSYKNKNDGGYIILRGDSSDGKNITEIKLMYYVGTGGFAWPFEERFTKETGNLKCPTPVTATNIKYEVNQKIANAFQGVNIGVRFGLPDGTVTTDEFKADGNLTEDQYYNPEDRFAEDEEETTNEEKEVVSESKAENNETAAEKLESLGLLKGTDKGIELEKEFNRAEAATMLVRLSGKEAEVTELMQPETEFSDIKNHWAKDYVSWCYQKGITKGTSETTYSPESNITAREYLTLTMRLMGYIDAEPETVHELAKAHIITDEAKLNEILSGDFTRDKMAYISFALLTSETADGELLINELISTGAVDSTTAQKIFNQ